MRGQAALACVVLTLGIGGARAETPTQEVLIQQLQEGDEDDRRHAAALLGDVGGEAAVPLLIDALKDEDEAVRGLAEHSLWAIWSRSGDAKIDALLQEGIHLLQNDRLDEAISKFDDVVTGAPAFAEGYNRRATTYYLMGQYEKSIADCEEAIKRNPLHFGAMSGLGYNYLQLEKPRQAIRYFEQVLEINPNKPKIRLLVEELKQVLRQKAKDSI